MTHSLENIGDTDLVFTTVEFKDSANAPLPLSLGAAGVWRARRSGRPSAPNAR